MTIIALVVGLAIGAAEALWLRRSALGKATVPLFVRLGLVAGALFLATTSGLLLPALAGWLSGFLLSVAVIAWRWS